MLILSRSLVVSPLPLKLFEDFMYWPKQLLTELQLPKRPINIGYLPRNLENIRLHIGWHIFELWYNYTIWHWISNSINSLCYCFENLLLSFWASVLKTVGCQLMAVLVFLFVASNFYFFISDNYHLLFLSPHNT